MPPRLPRTLAVAVATAATATGIAVAAGHAPAHRTIGPAHRPPVIAITMPGVGRVIATPHRQATYSYGPEAADHRVHCLGGCATIWPPLHVARTARIARRYAHLSGTFGVIRRPDGTRQLTRNGVPLYTFASDGHGTVTGNGVAGFSVVRG
jgi:predicted lipoprotein with Yx(FWY)xxD motif